MESTRQKAKIYDCPNKRMAGHELYRLRNGANLGRKRLGSLMDKWGWHRKKVERFEKVLDFELHPMEMADLLKALNADSLTGI